jgi:hypothetical protein
MALIVPGSLAGQVSGKVGGDVFSHNRSGPYVRNGATPVNRQTDAQDAIRSALASASSSWKRLTEGQRQAWEAYAANNPIMNRVGRSVRLAGNAAHVQINGRRIYLGSTELVAPPTAGAPDGLLTVSATWDIGSGSFGLVYTATPLAAGQKLHLSGCLLLSPSINFVKNRLRYFGMSAAAQASPFDFQTLFEAKFGTIAVGNKLVVEARIYDTATGLLSQPRRVEGIALTTP